MHTIKQIPLAARIATRRWTALTLALLLVAAGCTDDLQVDDAAAANAGQTSAAINPDAASSVSASTDDTSTVKRPWFGELHIHTRNSPDAFITGVRVSPEDAYRYAQGEAIDHVSGQKIQASYALDFIAITDHAEYMGILPALADPNGPLRNTRFGKIASTTNPQHFQDATLEILMTLDGDPPTPIPELDAPEVTSPIWQSYIELADKYYRPGEFTTLIGYEWTLIPQQQNLHRNVIFRGTDVPAKPFSAFDSDQPEGLWAWMEKARAEGSDVLAIPHNSNVSDGTMFALLDSDGNAFDAAYAARRMRNEPVVEMSQIKGTSETHPTLSPNDEWADFELLEELLGGTRNGKISGSYVREAYLNGLVFQSRGFNPFQFGMLAASDSHNASVPVEEANYTGKLGVDATAGQRRGGSFVNTNHLKYSAAGLAGVWAPENTREAIFDGIKSKEVFATSGPRMAIRLFAGDYRGDANKLDDRALYQQGVAMGEEIASQAPAFYIWAGKDPDGIGLERLQVIKGWYDGEELREQVIDVACAGDSQPDPTTRRCPATNHSVDLSSCQQDNAAGASQLLTLWEDPEFDTNQQAFYYARAIALPTCRWSTWDALRNEWELPESVHAVIQERAWSSPVWNNAGVAP